jgi:hypothetical protein
MATIIHLNCTYNNSNKNCWYHFANDMNMALQTQVVIQNKETYIVSLEDVEDEVKNQEE